jgi:hypothetical protein
VIEYPQLAVRLLHGLATEPGADAVSLTPMPDDEQLTVKQQARTYWVVERGSREIAGGPTRQAAEAERELVRRLRRRTTQMRSGAPRRPRASGVTR